MTLPSTTVLVDCQLRYKLDAETNGPLLVMGHGDHPDVPDSDFIDLTPFANKYVSRRILEIDPIRKLFVVYKATNRAVPIDCDRIDDSVYKWVSSNSSVLIGRSMQVKFDFVSNKDSDLKGKRYSLIKAEKFVDDRVISLLEGTSIPPIEAEDPFLTLIDKCANKTKTLVGLDMFILYLFHLATFEVPWIFPHLTREPDETKLKILNRAKNRVNEIPELSTDDRRILEDKLKWVEAKLGEGEEAFNTINIFVEQAKGRLVQYVVDSSRFSSNANRFYKEAAHYFSD